MTVNADTTTRDERATDAEYWAAFQAVLGEYHDMFQALADGDRDRDNC